MDDFFNNDNDLNNKNENFYNKQGDDIIQDDISGDYNNFSHTPNYNSYNYNSPASPGPKKPKRRHSTATVILSSVLAAVIGVAGALGAMFAYNRLNPVDYGNNKSNTSNVSINVNEEYASIAQAVSEKCSASVVGIRTTSSVLNFFGGSQEATGEGSGVIYTEDGYIITNYHVIENAVQSSSGSKIEVYIGDLNTTPHTASVVGYNIASDLAVIKINATGLRAVELGDSDELSIGQYVVTIGAPGGLEFMGSVTYGVISGLNRIVSTSQSIPLIQTDAAINPGNSGGALLNANGRLIGINSSKIVSEEFEGMGFAIPVNVVKEKCDKIISKQNEPEPYIGISISEKYTSEVLSYYGYPSGAVVLSVDSTSPAETAGIKRGDIITEFDGKQISEYTLLDEYLNDCDPGDKVTVKIYRSGKYYTAELSVVSGSSK